MSWLILNRKNVGSLIEEAAGTSKYKSRKLVAERKLERTQQNLFRVSDIVREIERQIRTMELQAKKAERYKALKAELREKDLLWASVQRQTLNDEIAKQEGHFTDAERSSGRIPKLFARQRVRERNGTLFTDGAGKRNQSRTGESYTRQRCSFSRKSSASTSSKRI